MKRATVLKPIQFLFCALLCFFGAGEAHAVMTTHAQGSWVTGSKYRVGGFEAEVPGRFRESANLTHGNAIGYASYPQETASGRPYYCNGDPVNGYDPDGRFGKGQDAGNAGMISSGDPNSPADAGLLTQSLWNGAGTGAQNGAGGAINAVSGYSGAFGSDPSSSEYTLGRNSIYAGEAAVITVGTGGLALEAAGGTAGLAAMVSRTAASVSANALYYAPAAATIAYKVGNALTGEIEGGFGAAATRPAVVLGEGMDSIKTATRALRAEGIDAKWYQAWGNNFKPENFNLEKSLLRNERWLKSKIDEGYDFYDIGIDAARARRSPFYELEQRILWENNITPIPLKRP